MKKLLFLSLILLAACSPGKKQTYDITYTDGTHEIVQVQGDLQFSSNGDCVETCECGGGEFKRCGVRSFAVVPNGTETTEITPDKNENKDSSVVVELPVNLKN
ncbi:MAG: hypothetical protein AABY15_02675 [Nanoarchaeota archaeon]